MAKSSKEIDYLSTRAIIYLNRLIIDTTGGYFVPPSNLHYYSSLLYALQIMCLPLPYRTLRQKAAALAYYIISRHVFLDGNKRTGMVAAWIFLESNGISVRLDSTAESLVLAIAKGKAGIREILTWIQRHS